ncbi:alkaline phosphatase D family protein [uncultured Thiohalocapsa sp.]|uniref:alkaline phosphatase D family protein n=1 Tax=uncultured Thiohalocapsa sp. TaxID=768990 RepID=UPI0025F28273|nr:alkaline phosphatase D family protein [uncultured Thiohalocapsa sp.]
MRPKPAWNRRELLRALAGLPLAGPAAAASAAMLATPSFPQDPFSLGVASGYPRPDGMVLWTRLAPEPLAPAGGMPPESVPVRWEVARDQSFRQLAAAGTAYATLDWAHAVHVEPYGLAPDREYWYRFHAGDATSPPGRTRTAPAADALADRLRIGVGSCQHYAYGWYTAYRHAAADQLDLFLHLGDYIYEASRGTGVVRSQGVQEPVPLEDYRRHYALYKSDPDLRAAHASCPWLLVWDDHEVDNDYAGSRSQDDDTPAWFLARRAAAYRAYYEHMPLPRGMVPFGPHMRIHTRLGLGRLATLHMLDNRQYRSPQPCPKPGRAGSNFISGDCSERLNPDATLLGARQERWLAAGLRGSGARWSLLGQQTLMAHADGREGDGELFFSDGWDGYPAARKRLLDLFAEGACANPVVLGGDVHSFWVADLKPNFADTRAPAVASEFVGTSISSPPPPEHRIQAVVRENPHIHYATGEHRGYLRLTLTPARLTADLRAVASVRERDATCDTLASFVVEDGRPGPVAA